MNIVLLTGRVTRDPELRSLASGRAVCTMSVQCNDDTDDAEFATVIAWDSLAEVVGRYVAKGAQVGIRGAMKTRTWDDDSGRRHWRTEVVAQSVELLGKKLGHEEEPE